MPINIFALPVSPDIESTSFYLLFQKSTDSIDISRRLAKALALYNRIRVFMRTGNKCWDVEFHYNWFGFGWKSFSTAHALQEGYMILVQHTRLNILDARIFNKMGKEIKHRWLEGVSKNSLSKVAKKYVTDQQDFVRPILKVRGASVQRTAIEFYAIEMFWNNYTRKCWNKVPTALTKNYGESSDIFQIFSSKDYRVLKGTDINDGTSWNFLITQFLMRPQIPRRILYTKNDSNNFRIHVFTPNGVEKENIRPLLMDWDMTTEKD